MIFEDIRSYLAVIRRRWWIIAILFGSTMLVVLLSTATAKPVYRTQVKLQVLAAERQEIYLFSQFRSSGETDDVKASQADFIAQLRSPFVAWQTIADLNLAIGADELLNHLSIATDGDYVIMEVSADEPDVAEGIANRQTANALEQYRKMRSLPSTVLREFITNQLKTEEDHMLTAESEFLAFKREHALQDYESELSALQGSIRSLKAQADQARVLQEQLTVRAAKERKEAEAALEEAASMSTAPYSAQALRDQAAQWSAMAVQHEVEAAAQEAAVEAINKLIEERTEEMRALLDLSASYSALRRGVEQTSNNYDFLVSKLNEASLKESQAQNLGFVQMVEPPSTPSGPAPSRFARVAVVAAIVSLLAGVVLAFALEFVDSLRKRLSRV